MNNLSQKSIFDDFAPYEGMGHIPSHPVTLRPIHPASDSLIESGSGSERHPRYTSMVMLTGVAILVFAFLLIVTVGGVHAQDSTTVTDDQVNAIAKRMFCPVCENIPLDTCGTAACEDWRYEIRLMLEDGKTEEQIRADFVDRFGDRVVGVPHNPVLRILSLLTPWLLGALALWIGVTTLRRWRLAQAIDANQGENSDAPVAKNDYRALLEQDLYGDNN